MNDEGGTRTAFVCPSAVAYRPRRLRVSGPYKPSRWRVSGLSVPSAVQPRTS